MKKIRCIAIDDEPIALMVISRFCERKGGIDLRTFSEPNIGLAEIVRQSPDIVFLDIEMGDVSGIELAAKLPPSTCLIFTTAHAQYALSGFELDAVDFLHKPYSFDRFERAVDKAMRMLEDRNGSSLVVKQEYSNVVIPVDDIVYIEAMENYAIVHRFSGDRVVSRTNLKKICEMLPERQFVRIHKSFVVPVRNVSGYTRTQVSVKGLAYPLPIGKTYLGYVLSVLES